MPSRTAQRLCPSAIFLPTRFDAYRAVSQQIMTIFRQQTALVEPLSLDEAYLDVTAAVHTLDETVQLAQEIRRQIWEQTQLTASAGVSYCYVDISATVCLSRALSTIYSRVPKD